MRLSNYNIFGIVLDAGNTFNRAQNRIATLKLAKLEQFWPQEKMFGVMYKLNLRNLS